MRRREFLRGGGSGPDYVVVSNHMVQCMDVDGVMLKPEGHMVRSDQYEYCLYSLGQRGEFLVDMEAIRGMMVNLAGKRGYAKVLAKHRGYLREFAERYGDETAVAMLVK